MRRELPDRTLDDASDLREMKLRLLVECERLLRIEESKDFDVVADVDAYSNVSVT